MTTDKLARLAEIRQRFQDWRQVLWLCAELESALREQDADNIALGILLANKPGAALNAVREDYPELAKQVESVIADETERCASIMESAPWNLPNAARDIRVGGKP